MIVPMNYNDADGPPCDGKEVQICNVDGDKEIDIKYATEGELVNVWFMGKTRAAWLARSLDQSRIDAGF